MNAQSNSITSLCGFLLMLAHIYFLHSVFSDFFFYYLIFFSDYFVIFCLEDLGSHNLPLSDTQEDTQKHPESPAPSLSFSVANSL